ncbi:MAG TPA: ComF family protein, partial [Candidatus Caenarcaniphilales bacterium]
VLAAASHTIMKLTSTLKDWLNLFFYTICPLCGRTAADELCPDCQRQIKSCQLPNSRQSGQGDLLFSWGSYQGALKRAIAALKYDNQPQLARPLGQWLAQAWLASECSHSRLIVVPIPLHRYKQKQRGYNQAALLARSFCNLTGLPLRSDGLERVQKTPPQFGLSISQRRQNLDQAFSVGKDFLVTRPTHPVLLLDDIYTTGATARAVTKTLQDSRIQVRGILTVAFAEQLRQSRSG